jgi:hypothetical protein
MPTQEESQELVRKPCIHHDEIALGLREAARKTEEYHHEMQEIVTEIRSELKDKAGSLRSAVVDLRDDSKDQRADSKDIRESLLQVRQDVRDIKQEIHTAFHPKEAQPWYSNAIFTLASNIGKAILYSSIGIPLLLLLLAHPSVAQHLGDAIRLIGGTIK